MGSGRLVSVFTQGTGRWPMRLWDDELEAARETIRAESQEFVARFPSVDLTTGSVLERAQARRAAESATILRSEKGFDRTIAGPVGPLRLREFRPERVDGAMLHIHGGGWMTGEPEMTDLLNEALCEQLNLAIVSLEYRLAPEHPYPEGPDDCEAAAAWLVQNGKKEVGTDALTIGGESAGGHLTAVTILRMRDRHGYTEFRGANIVYGTFDLSMTPSQRQFGNTRLVLRTIDMQQFYNAFLPIITDRRVPDISPLYADLKNLCPALFTVGTKDALLDDTLFMHTRWVAAGNEAELAIYPGGAHAAVGVPDARLRSSEQTRPAQCSRITPAPAASSF